MKKKLKTLLGIILPTAVCAGAIFAFSAVAANKYDVTGDGRVNSHDLVNMMKYLSGEIKYEPSEDTVPTVNPDEPKDTDKPVITDEPKDTDKPVTPDDPQETDAPTLTLSTVSYIDIEGPEEFPGEELPFEVVGVGLLTYDYDNGSTFIFDDAAKAAEYLSSRYVESVNLPDAVLGVDTAKKRIIIFNIAGPSWTHYYHNLRELEKLSLHEGRLAVLYADREDPDFEVDCAEGYIVTVVAVDRELLPERPDVERYTYKTIK